MRKPAVSQRGVYYDLSKSPYVVQTIYGDVFRFSSAKKMEIFNRDSPAELARLEKLLNRHYLIGHIPAEMVDKLRQAVLKSFYHKVES